MDVTSWQSAGEVSAIGSLFGDKRTLKQENPKKAYRVWTIEHGQYHQTPYQKNIFKQTCSSNRQRFVF